MTADWRAAINHALRLQQQPDLAETFRRSPLPEGMSALIRLVSDQGSNTKELAASLAISDALLKSAASQYLLLICLYPGSSDVRVLGLNAGASFKLAKEHHRLLLKWLHPDRNIDNKAFAERVNQAWSAFKLNSLESMPVDYLPGTAELDLPVAKTSSGRFPFFLTGLIAGVCFLLGLSILPDNDIYVGEPDSSAQSNNESTNEQSVQTNLQSLKASLQSVVATVLPDNKSPASNTASINSDTKKSVQSTNVQLKNNQPTSPLIEKTSKNLQVAKRSKTVSTQSNASDGSALEQTQTVSAAVVSASTAQDNAALQQLNQNKDAMHAAQVLVQNFQHYYQQGDIVPFMRLFSTDARNNRGGRDALEQDYAKLFADSVQRKISFSHIRWQQSNAMLMFDARYSANVKRPGELFSSGYKGSIKLVFSNQNEHILIQQVLLDN
jgi:hypothetical protein